MPPTQAQTDVLASTSSAQIPISPPVPDYVEALNDDADCDDGFPFLAFTKGFNSWGERAEWALGS